MTPRTRSVVAVCGLLAIAAVFGRAGFWQWQRAVESRALRSHFEHAATEAPRRGLPAGLDEDERFQRVVLAGTYVEAPQFLLDNMLREGIPGYHVLTALRIPGRRELVIVNRGWTRADLDRRVLPQVRVPAALQQLNGRLERLPQPGLRFDSVSDRGPTPALVVVQFPTADDLARLLEAPVLDYQVLLDAGEPDGLARDWSPPGLPPERHLAYAVQWWLFAAGAVLAPIVIATRRRRQRL